MPYPLREGAVDEFDEQLVEVFQLVRVHGPWVEGARVRLLEGPEGPESVIKEALSQGTGAHEGQARVATPDETHVEVRKSHLLEGPTLPLERVPHELLDDDQHRPEDVAIRRMDHLAGEVRYQDPSLCEQEHLLESGSGRGRDEAELHLQPLRGGLDLELHEAEVRLGPNYHDERRLAAPEVADHDLGVVGLEDDRPRRFHPDELGH